MPAKAGIQTNSPPGYTLGLVVTASISMGSLDFRLRGNDGTLFIPC